MRRFSLSVGMRLWLGFGMVIFLLAAVTALGIFSLANSRQSADSIVYDAYPRIVTANRIKTEADAIALAIRNALLLDREADIRAQLATIQDSRKRIDEDLARFSQSDTGDGREVIEGINAAKAVYRQGQDEFIALVAEGSTADATHLMLDKLIPAQATYIQEVEKIVTLGNGLMAKASGNVHQQYSRGLVLMLALCGGAIVLACGFAWWITRSITRPLSAAVRVARTVAAGDLSSSIETHGKDETGQLLQALKGMNDSLARVVGEVREGTRVMASAAGQVAAGNVDLSSRTEQQAAALQETAASMEQITSIARQNADNSQQASQLAGQAAEVANKGGAVITRVVDTMGSIDDSSRKIVDIINVIDGIAFQTNILALNAAIEAAQAGEHGRGFAVVASEVRRLAQRSATAAKEIKELIDDSVSKVGSGTRLVDEAGSTMREIVSSIQSVADIMGEITAASSEQAQGIEQINLAITQMDQATQQNAGLVQQAANAAESMDRQAEQLARSVAIFKLQQDGPQAAPDTSRDRAPTPPQQPVLALSNG